MPSEDIPCAALLLAEDLEADMDVLDRLRRDGVDLRDRLDDQRAGLAALGDDLPDEAPRWAYYPWSRIAVRILGPAGFDRLRLDRNRNKITAEEQARLRSAKVGVVGLSVGYAVAYTLALEGACGALRLADFDELELSNMNRLPVSVTDLGVNKAVIAARRIAELDPYLPVEVWTDGVTPDTVGAFCRDLDVVVDECDSLDVKLLIRTEAARRRLPVVMHTSDRGLLDVERFDLDGDLLPFHGLLGDIDPETLQTLSTRDKVPYVLCLLDPEEISARMAASMLEVGESLETWPQLGADVGLGGVTVSAAVRGIVLGHPIASGRGRVDLDRHLDALDVPSVHSEAPDVPSVHSEAPDVASAAPGVPAGASPDGETPQDPLEAVIDAAIRAPSGGNAQPWSIVVEPDCLTFALAPEPEPVLMDLHRRGSLVALGAALHNARVAAANHKILGPATVLDPPGEPEPGVPLAHLELGSDTDPDLAAYHSGMLARATNRSPGDPHTVTDDELEAMHAAARLLGGRIEVVTESDDIARLAEILTESDRVRYLDGRLRSEMVAELRWPDDPDPDSGIEVDSLGLDTAEAAMLDVVLRDDALDLLEEWGLGRGLGRMTRDRVLGSAGLVAVFTEGRSPADYIRGGAVVESVWIAAQEIGLAVQPVSPVFLYADTRSDLEHLSPEHVDDLDVLRQELAAVLEVPAGGGLALLLRFGRASAATMRSRRRNDRVRHAGDVDGLIPARG
ncbi:Rv1355c family protein [Rhodococcus pyridinivorans]|uniref:Rv1355c family protein n=1 Tax=Rhodococcus pyridinivorans TaxID=103816 RepID=A0A7M2XQE8_9NOCA|nr:Rv1355c family protein [Rhodococcus pyridinivorans]QOV99847.1 Rv1355c family protein [Rhodococcus pyridinivorans]WMM73736.1 Rv1355c family protein [Rhodococcus pyridinivorans]